MNLYRITIIEEIIDKTTDCDSRRKVNLDFISNDLRSRYLIGYLQPFLNQFKQSNYKGYDCWLDSKKTYDVIYRYQNTETEINIITDVPLANERANAFDRNRLNKYIEDKRPIEERRELAIKNPLQFYNENSTPYSFNLSFKGIDIY